MTNTPNMKKIDWKNISPATYVRYILMFLAVINSILNAFGVNPLLVDGDESRTAEFISNVVTLILLVVNTWCNNSVTAGAIAADKYKDKLKSGEITQSPWIDEVGDDQDIVG